MIKNGATKKRQIFGTTQRQAEIQEGGDFLDIYNRKKPKEYAVNLGKLRRENSVKSKKNSKSKTEKSKGKITITHSIFKDKIATKKEIDRYFKDNNIRSKKAVIIAELSDDVFDDIASKHQKGAHKLKNRSILLSEFTVATHNTLKHKNVTTATYMAVNKIIQKTEFHNIKETTPNHFQLTTYIYRGENKRYLFYRTILKVTENDEILLISLSKGTRNNKK